MLLKRFKQVSPLAWQTTRFDKHWEPKDTSHEAVTHTYLDFVHSLLFIIHVKWLFGDFFSVPILKLRFNDRCTFSVQNVVKHKIIMTLCQENSKSCLISRMIFIRFYVRFHELLRKRTVNILLKQNNTRQRYRNECQESISKTWLRYACLVFEVFHIHLKCHVTRKLLQACHT